MSRARFLRATTLAALVLFAAATTTVPSDASTGQAQSQSQQQTQARAQAGQQHAADALQHKRKKHKKKKHHHKKKHHKKKKAAAPKPAPAPTTAATPPTNAGKIFRWGNASLHDEFEVAGPSASAWTISPSGTGLVRNQHGMLTLNTTPSSGTVTADWKLGARQYGRWEARVRTRQYDTTGTSYRALWELVPSSGEQCARNIVLSDSTIGQNPATLHVRNQNVDFTMTKTLDLRQDVFHTYAIEVTPDHISWFIDTKVVMTERRSAARTGAAYTVRFQMLAPTGATMNTSRMQMDWVRYYTLERKNAQPITAPAATQKAYSGGC